jgi:hypothetical protein
MKIKIIKTVIWPAILAIAIVGLAACGGPTPTAEPTEAAAVPTDTPVPPTDTPVPPSDTPVPPTDTPVPPTDTPAPPTDTPAPPTDTPTPDLASLSSENYVGCHTDEKTLQALAEDKSVKSEATSGEG